MATVLICSRGHRWDWGETIVGDVATVACPVCGALCAAAECGTAPLAPADGLSTGHKPIEAGTVQVPPRPRVSAPPSIVPPPAGPDAEEPLPKVPGYELLGCIGRGGGGVVYRARQRGANRIVAVKMLQDGRGDLEARLRLFAEAEAVARLQHPGVVQVFEVGEADGRPFLALEYCAGGSLAGRLADGPLVPVAAAEVLEPVARAVHAAHLAGVIHRDLKPGNILLQSAADAPAGMSGFTPKVADFGLARALDTDGSQTETGMALGTPCYMAPEQAGDSKRVGPAADVYGLGSVLYHLLTGRPPFHGASPYDTIEQVRTREPVPPRRLQPKVPRDLETICLKCLRKEPAKRYASAAELADDLRRFLEGKPVRAQPVSAAERLAKWARRQPATAALVALLVAAVAAAAIAGTWYHIRLQAQRDRAEANLRRAVRSVDVLLTEVADEDLAGEPRMERKRRALLEKALAFCQELLASEGDGALLREQTALAAKRVGDIQRQLGRYDEALAAYAQAIRMFTDMGAEGSDRSRLLRELADCENFTGEVYRLTARPDEAADAYRRAERIQEGLLAADPADVGGRRDLARSHYNLGIVARDRNSQSEARAELAEAARLLEGLLAEAPNDADTRQHLARAYLNLGPALRAADPVAAREALRHSAELYESLAAEYPGRPAYRHELAACLNNTGDLESRAGRPAAARPPLRRACSLLTKLADDFPDVTQYRVELANACNTLAAAAAQQSEFTDADHSWAEAQSQWERLLREQPGVADHHGDLGITLGNRGRLRLLQGDPAGARPLLERALTEDVAALNPNPDRPAFREALRNHCRDLADTLTRLGEHATLRKQADALSRSLPAHSAGPYHAACMLARGVRRLREMGSAETSEREARAHSQAAAAIVRAAAGHATDLAPLLGDGAFAPLGGEEPFVSLLRPATGP